MEIKELKETSTSTIVDCLNRAFSNYFVQLPTGVAYWETRFRGARVDLNASVGLFEENELVAFILNGIDQHNNKLTAFNTGTGVLPEYRGRKFVDKMYEALLPKLRAQGVQKSMLEVIRDNSRAIKVYERIGFTITRELFCFDGLIRERSRDLSVKEVPFRSIFTYQKTEDLYSWDNSNAAILEAGGIYKTFLVSDDSGNVCGYFTLNPAIGYLVQIEAVDGTYAQLLGAVAGVKEQIRINNLDGQRQDLIAALRECGLHSSLSQYEMEMEV